MKPCNGNDISAHAGGGGGDESQCTVREQDRFMPIANVIRIMRKVLPTHAKISDDAKETIQECVSEYISFITSEANERCQLEQRKTITAEDVLWAMSKLGFDDYVDPLGAYLHRYRELEGEHRGSIRGEPLQFKRSAMAAGAIPALQHGNEQASAVGGIYGMAPANVPYHLPALAHQLHHHHLHHHLGVYSGDGAGGYYLGGVHGDPGGDTSQAPAANFDPYGSYR